jgi:hypothetical protein
MGTLLRGRATECDADHSQLYTAEVKDACSYMSAPHTSSTHGA